MSAHALTATRYCKQPNCTDEAVGTTDYCRAHKPQPKLEELIDQQIALGHRDPHQFPDLLRKTLGTDLLAVVRPYLDDFIGELSRQRMSAKRRADVAKITNHTIANAEILLRSMWVPAEKGNSAIITYKPIGNMTADDFDARAAYLERMAVGIHISAQWCRNVADQMRTEGATTAKELSALPPLPEPDEDL